jgi:hypothetical protein
MLTNHFFYPFCKFHFEKIKNGQLFLVLFQKSLPILFSIFIKILFYVKLFNNHYCNIDNIEERVLLTKQINENNAEVKVKQTCERLQFPAEYNEICLGIINNKKIV